MARRFHRTQGESVVTTLTAANVLEAWNKALCDPASSPEGMPVMAAMRRKDITANECRAHAERVEPDGFMPAIEEVGRQVFCLNCGMQLPADARFCDQCGAQQRTAEERAAAPRLVPEAPISVLPEQWEYCEITEAKGFINCHFEAVVAGPGGSRIEGKWPAMPGVEPGRINRMNVDRLVQELIAAGWEPQPKGSEWYAHRFRKRWR